MTRAHGTKGEVVNLYTDRNGIKCVPVKVKRKSVARTKPKPKRVGPGPQHKSVREMVYERDGHACVYCGDNSRLTVDHVIPKSRGGSNTTTNLVTCCFYCNSAKGADSVEVFCRRFALAVPKTGAKD